MLLYSLFVRGAWEQKGYSTEGGPECYAYTSATHSWLTTSYAIIAACLLVWAVKRKHELRKPSSTQQPACAKMMQWILGALILWRLQIKGSGLMHLTHRV